MLEIKQFASIKDTFLKVLKQYLDHRGVWKYNL